jgi:hypothetical protein
MNALAAIPSSAADLACFLLPAGTVLWWGLWRRCLGGFLGIRRSILFPVAALMAAVPFHANLWLMGAAAVSVVFWAPGHKTDSWTVWLRYPGPMALGYVLGRRFQAYIPQIGGFIERGGWMAVGELWAGLCFGAALVATGRII